MTGALRRTWLRRLTDLPYRVEPFAAIVAAERSAAVNRTRPGYSGILRSEPGAPFRVQPTRWIGPTADVPGSAASAYFTCEPDRVVYALADAGVHGVHGAVYHPGRRSFVAETVEDWDHATGELEAFSHPRFPRARTLPGTTLVLSSLGAQTFYHFFIETLPKLAVAREWLTHCDQVLIPRYGLEWKQRWLQPWQLGGKLRVIDELSHLRCEQAIFVGRVARHFEAGPWAVQTLRQLPDTGVSGSAAAASDIIWADRGGAHLRRVPWEADVAPALGARSVRFDELSPQQAACACAGARVLAGFHGAALCNMVFCPPGTAVLEIMATPHRPWYSRLAQACGHRHAAMLAGEGADAVARIAAAVRELSR